MIPRRTSITITREEHAKDPAKYSRIDEGNEDGKVWATGLPVWRVGSWNGFSALNCLPGAEESLTVYPGPSAVDAAAEVDKELWWIVNKTRAR